MTYTQEHSPQNYCECEFTVPIKLNVPITINSEVCINYIHPVKQKLPVLIQPELMLEPEVKAKSPKCDSPLPYQSKEMLPTTN